jgi:hypothetical protein
MKLVSRREFLNRWAMGFGGLALQGLAANGVPTGRPHFTPKAKSVIVLFMAGGVSHMESFDPKPLLNKYAGKKIIETPFADAINNNAALKNVQRGLGRKILQGLYPLQTGFKKYGKSGIEVSDWWPHVGKMVDEISIVRSMWTTDNNHQAQYQMLTGRNIVEGNFPSLGSWVHYGLGTLNENLPQFIVMGRPMGSCCGSHMGHGADYLGPQHGGVLIDTSGSEAVPFVNRPEGITAATQKELFDLAQHLSAESQVEYPEEPMTEARIRSYELAFRMQMAVPDVMDLSHETPATRELYGLDRKDTDNTFAKQCLLARRFVEAGTRFIQIHHGTGGAGAWDAHSELKKSYDTLCPQVDQPIAGLLQDLKQRGMLDETLVVFATEFGRTPGLETAEIQANTREGRDHHPFGFSVWLAGGGVKGGLVHGATDELGFHAVENRHYVTDLHATILHQLGLEPHRLDIPGRKRLEKDYGKPILDILA